MQIKKDEIIGYLELQIFNAEQEQMARREEINKLKNLLRIELEKSKKWFSIDDEQSFKKEADKITIKIKFYSTTKQIKSLEKEIEAFDELIDTAQIVIQAMKQQP